MSSNLTTPQALGYNSWTELYEHMRQEGLQDEKTITLTWPDDTDRLDMNLHMPTIKAKAFDELYERLPGRKAVDVLKEMVASTSLQSLSQFLDKLPTRPE